MGLMSGGDLCPTPTKMFTVMLYVWHITTCFYNRLHNVLFSLDECHLSKAIFFLSEKLGTVHGRHDKCHKPIIIFRLKTRVDRN